MINGGRKTVDAPLDELTAGGRSLEALFARETARDVADAEGSEAGEAAAAGGEGA